MSVLPALAALVGVVAAVAAFFRWIRPRWRELRRDVRAVRDTLLGREAPTDSITGEELGPAIPSIGQRMAIIERGHVTNGEQILENSKQINTLVATVTSLAENKTRIDNFEKRQAELEVRVGDLERNDRERVLAREESIQLLHTIESVMEHEGS